MATDNNAQQRKRPTHAAFRLRRTWALNGPNAWIDRPAVRLLLDTGNPTGEAHERLRVLMSGGSLTPGPHTASDEAAPPDLPGDPGALLATIVLELQQLAGDQVFFGTSSPTRREDRFEVVCECYETDLALAAAEVAARFLSHLVYQTDPDFDFNREFHRRVMYHIRYRESQREQQSIKRAAERRGIPVRMANKHQRLVEFGLGAYTERLLAIMTSKSIEIASRIARNKPLANAVMREHGVPVPDGATVRNLEEAIRVVERIGYPVAVKPSDLKHGNAVTVDIGSLEELTPAVEAAVAASRSGRALVETMIKGREYRVSVVGDAIPRVMEKVVAHVIGDGAKTIAQLIDIVNQDPERTPGQATNLIPITIDETTHAALERQNLTIESIPEPGQYVEVKLVSNVHQGGSTVLRTDEIHPDNAAVSRLAAKAVGLDMCGLDLIVPDISQSIWEVGGAVLEVNSEPQFRASSDPDLELPMDMGMAVVEMFYPSGRPCQPKIAVIAGARHGSSAASVLHRILRANGMTVGLARAGATEFDGPDFVMSFPADRPNIHQVARNPYVTAGIFEIDQQEIEERGLPFLQCDVAVVGSGEIRPPSSGARPAGRMLAGLVSSTGAVICDRDDHLLDREGLANGPRLFLTSVDPLDAMVGQHLQQGGCAMTVDNGVITYRSPETETPILAVEDIRTDLHDLTLIALLQAVAAAVALNVSVEVIRDSLRRDS
ncbi:MAG: hypothetical protein AB7V46_03515 [Thermomicrobiales bacterium]